MEFVNMGNVSSFAALGALLMLGMIVGLRRWRGGR